MNVNAFLQKDYENEPPSGPKKQTQTNPIQTQFFQRPKSLAKKSGHTRQFLPAFFIAGKADLMYNNLAKYQ